MRIVLILATLIFVAGCDNGPGVTPSRSPTSPSAAADSNPSTTLPAEPDAATVRRRAYWDDVCRAEARADREATAKYPEFGRAAVPPPPPASPGDLEKYGDMKRQFSAAYKADVRLRHQVTETEAKAISIEAIERRWQVPKDSLY